MALKEQLRWKILDFGLRWKIWTIHRWKKWTLQGSGAVERLHLYKSNIPVQYLHVFLSFVEFFIFNWKWIFYFILQLSQPAF